MLISHELPTCMLGYLDVVKNDFEFVLAHRILQDLEYARFYTNYRKTPIYLDNSAYELGESIERGVYYNMICMLKPAVYVAPDRPGDWYVSKQMLEEWLEKVAIPHRNTKVMGAVQGATIDELFESYAFVAGTCDVVGVPFRLPHNYPRNCFLDSLVRSGRFKEMPHHLLGVDLPQNLNAPCIRENKYIVSIDTSSPICAAYEGVAYTADGIKVKPKTRVEDIGGMKNHLELAFQNIVKFKELVKGV